MHARLVFVNDTGSFCLNGSWYHAGGMYAGHLCEIRPLDDDDYATCSLVTNLRHVRLCRCIAKPLILEKAHRHAA
jgi:hypothetical protein